jgi:protein-L-isoaspartate(D-aspartate) O-methyltransferase
MNPAERMVRDQVEERGVANPRVLAAMRSVPRHEFVPEDLVERAYEDCALPIGHEQTISQPYIVGFMTAALDPQPQHRVLEIGTGCGYQAAVLSPLVREVCTIEIVEPLAAQAALTLRRLGYDNVRVRCGDGHHGWPDAAPFDSIIVTCAPGDIPAPLVEQLREGGRMIIPVGPRGAQELILLEKHKGEMSRKRVMRVAFVPMTGPGV